MGQKFILGYDVGTGGCKAVLATVDGVEIDSAFEPYDVSYPKEHFAEQDPEDWWRGVSTSTRTLIEKTGTDPSDIAGLAFASQMLGVLPMGAEGTPLRPGIIWMDCRAEEQARKVVRKLGGPQVMMQIFGAVPSGKDVMCKIKWLKDEEPDIFERTRFFLDVKGYVVYRATGKFETDQTAASVTGFMDNKTRGWSSLAPRLVGASLDKMPTVKGSFEVVGGLTDSAAKDMGLDPRTPVISGMGDAPSGAVGAGALSHGESSISIGTSGLLCITSEKRLKLGRSGMATIAAADPTMWLVVGETNTAGACLGWFADNLARESERSAGGDESGLMKVLDEVAGSVPAGSNKVIFTPWMYGERAPVTDTTLRGAFVNVAMDNTREDMLRSVFEGVAMNFRWMFDAAARKGLPCNTVRAIGGGAKSDVWMQIFADVTNRRIESVERPQDAGALGAALAVPVALGIYESIGAIKDVVKVRKAFEPERANLRIYNDLFASFKVLYDRLSPAYKTLNG
ncbi:MAG: xylulokinase [Candidatus Geothermincolia bacterium]